MLAKKLKPRSIEHLAALVSIMRPGCLEAMRPGEDGKMISVTDHYILRKNGEEMVTYFHPALKNSLESTYGEMIYQEQAMQIARDVAGFTLQQADILRKAIGKKKADIMAQVKADFMVGVEKTGVVIRPVAEEIFGWIEKSQRYSFNKSHAVSYAVNAYLSAYAKAHFKRAFFTSYLHFAKEKQKPHEEIRELINNAKIMDVEVYPPDLRRKNAHFRLIGNNIYFGMTDIKGVGDSAIPKFEKRLAEVTPVIGGDIGKWTWMDFLIYLSQKLNKTIVEGLIKVGGLRWMAVSRQRMWHEYEQYSKLTEKEKEWVTQEYMQSKFGTPFTTLAESLEDLLIGPTGRGKGISNKPRHDKITGILKLVVNPPSPMLDTPAWLSSVEQSLLGISVTCTAVDECNEHMSNSNCKDYITGEGRSQNVLLAVQVDDVKQITTKHGDDMAFLTVSDGSASLESVVLFPSQWDTHQKLLFAGNTIMLYGERGKKDSFIVENVLQI